MATCFAAADPLFSNAFLCVSSSLAGFTFTCRPLGSMFGALLQLLVFSPLQFRLFSSLIGCRRLASDEPSPPTTTTQSVVAATSNCKPELAGALCGLLGDRAVSLAPSPVAVVVAVVLCRNQWLLRNNAESTGSCCWYHLWMPICLPEGQAFRLSNVVTDDRFLSDRLVDDDDNEDDDEDDRLTTSELRRRTSSLEPSPVWRRFVVVVVVVLWF